METERRDRDVSAPGGRGTPPSPELLSPALFPNSRSKPCVWLIRGAQFALQDVRGGMSWLK
jgi:hypothetical protein